MWEVHTLILQHPGQLKSIDYHLAKQRAGLLGETVASESSQKCIRSLCFSKQASSVCGSSWSYSRLGSTSNQGSSVGGSSEELQLIGVQTAVFGLAKPSGDTDWSSVQEFGLAELLKRQAGFSTWLGLSQRDPGMFSHPGRTWGTSP